MGEQKRVSHLLHLGHLELVCGDESYTYYTLATLGLFVEMGLTPITPWTLCVCLWRGVLHLLHLGHLGLVCGEGSYTYYTLDTLGLFCGDGSYTYDTSDTLDVCAEAGLTNITPWTPWACLWRWVLRLLHLGHLGRVCGDDSCTYYTLDTLDG